MTAFVEKWVISDSCEVLFYLYPGLPIIIEIHCQHKQELVDFCNKFNLNYKDGFTTDKYNELYNMNINVLDQELSFKNYKSVLVKNINKNKDSFNLLNEKYYRQFLKKEHYCHL